MPGSTDHPGVSTCRKRRLPDLDDCWDFGAEPPALRDPYDG
ncbi:hypothetical protein ACIF6L_34080 [Kitasatospora sp. NPDC086009]